MLIFSAASKCLFENWEYESGSMCIITFVEIVYLGCYFLCSFFYQVQCKERNTKLGEHKK
jgi:hypothetical protein